MLNFEMLNDINVYFRLPAAHLDQWAENTNLFLGATNLFSYCKILESRLIFAYKA